MKNACGLDLRAHVVYYTVLHVIHFKKTENKPSRFDAQCFSIHVKLNNGFHRRQKNLKPYNIFEHCIRFTDPKRFFMKSTEGNFAIFFAGFLSLDIYDTGIIHKLTLLSLVRVNETAL